MSGQVVAVASGKGGVGKTTTVVNLGVVLRRADHSVALVDADLGMANLGPMLGVTGERTLHDVLAGSATVEEAAVEEAPGFAVLGGSAELTDYPGAAPEALGDVLETLAESYDFVIVDTGAGMSHEDVLPLGLADQVILVTTPDPAAIGDTRKTAELADLAEGSVAGVVVNKAESDTDAKHVASEVGVPLIGVVPYDATVRRSTAAGRPLEAVDPDTPAAAAYRELASTLADDGAEPLEGAPTVGAEGASADAESDEAESAGSPEANPETDDEDAPEEAAGEPADDEDGSADEGNGQEEAEDADGGEDEEEEEEEEDYLAEWEDDEPERSGGFLSRLGRLFR